jgi:hypothetical protein
MAPESKIKIQKWRGLLLKLKGFKNNGRVMKLGDHIEEMMFNHISLSGGKGSNPFTVIISTFDCVLTIFYRSWPSIDVRPVSSVG